MGLAKRMLEEGHSSNKDIWIIEGRKTNKKNPFIGRRLRVRWLKPWGKGSLGFVAEGILEATFAKHGRRLIGILRLNNGKKLSCPWSRRYLAVEVL